MPKLLRALLISAAATSVAALVLGTLKHRSTPLSPVPPSRPEIDADDLPPAHRQQLMEELASQL